MKILWTLVFLVFGFFLVFVLFDAGIATWKIKFLSTENIVLENGFIDLESMTLQQKIGQMIMVRGDDGDLRFNRMNVGGVFLDRQESEEKYRELIRDFQDDAVIGLLVSSDLEGVWTPFPDREFPFFSDIENVSMAYNVGFDHGVLLRDVGFNLNFAPIAEYDDEVYGGRVFVGNVSGKVGAYIEGLQENVMGTCKHYPGRAMDVDLHYFSDEVVIDREDLELFDVCLNSGIGAIMVSHQIVSGEVDSFGKPSSVSSFVIDSIDADVLIIADEVNMRGLSMFYSSKVDMYVDLINAGEDFILDFDLDVVEFYDLVGNIEKAVLDGRIDEDRIDESVGKIFEIKGWGNI